MTAPTSRLVVRDAHLADLEDVLRLLDEDAIREVADGCAALSCRADSMRTAAVRGRSRTS